MKVLTIIMGVLLILGGIFCLVFPGMTFLGFVWVLGILLVVAGVMMIVNYFSRRKLGIGSVWEVIGGVLTIILALVILFNQFARFLTDVLVVYLFAAALLVGGIMRIVGAVQVRKVPGSGWGWILTFGILLVLLGIYCFFAPSVTAFALGWLVAFMIIFEGINLIASGAAMKKSA